MGVGAGQRVLEACERCQGKLHICQISKQVISANNSEENSQSVSVLGSHTPSLSSLSLLVVVVSRSKPLTLRGCCFVPFVLFVHVNCFCPLKIQQRNQKKKKRTKINETNPERGNPVPCHAFLMKCRRLRNILWHDLIVVLLCLRATRQRVKRGRQVVSNV